MAFKKQSWIELGRNGVKFELVVRDQDFKRLETRKFTPQNFSETIKDIGNRYGIKKEMLTPNKEFEEEMGFLSKAGILR